MNNFEITFLKEENILIFMKTSEAPFDFWEKWRWH